MWKNKISHNGINDSGLVRVSLRGQNLELFIKKLIKENIAFSQLKRQNSKCLKLTISYKDLKKAFAIARSLCYNNIKVEKRWGFAFDFFNLLKNVGMLIGMIALICWCWVYDGFILSIDYYGSGKALSYQVEEVLKSQGVCAFSRFESFDLNKLSGKVLSSVPQLNYVNIYKCGNRLNVQLVSGEKTHKIEDQNCSQLFSDCEGKILKIQVLRGTSVVNVGDSVNNGDLLIDGFLDINGNKVYSNVLGTVVLLAKKSYSFSFDEEADEELVECLAVGEFNDEYTFVEIEKETEKGYNYKVNIFYQRRLTAG